MHCSQLAILSDSHRLREAAPVTLFQSWSWGSQLADQNIWFDRDRGCEINSYSQLESGNNKQIDQNPCRDLA